MQKEVQKNLKKIISLQDTLLIGVSGGADSVCLLVVLCALSREMDFSVEAVHVEHGIRGQESIEDARYVESLCQALQVPLTSVSVDVPAYCKEWGLGIEEGARILRYEVFERLAKEKKAKVALAHHMEDNAETILFQLIRGSSISGLCGMQPLRISAGGVAYIRPLLSVHREEIEQFLQSKGIAYRTDSSNASLDYSRNFIRRVVLPELQKVNAQSVRHINAAAAQLWDIRQFLEEETKKAWEQAVSKETKQRLWVDVERLSSCPPAVQKELLYQAAADMLGTKKNITAVHVEELLKLCKNQPGKELHLPQGLAVKKEYEKLLFFFGSEQQNVDNSLQKGVYISQEQLEKWKCSKETVRVLLGENGAFLQIRVFPFVAENTEILQKTYTKWLDYDKIKSGFCIRTGKSGDAFISDAFGHRKKLKRYFIDEKIPAGKRAHMLLLAQEQTVLWLIGGRISEHIKVGNTTKTIIEITYNGGNEDECGKWTQHSSVFDRRTD